VTAQTNDLVTAIQLARSEALKRGANMVVCASDTQTTCTGKDTWSSGWIVFSDLNLNNAPDVGTGKCLDTEDCIMATRKGLPEGSTLTTEDDADFVCFLPTGLSGTNTSSSPTSCTPETGNVTPVEFVLKAKNCERNQARKVTITPQGHTLVSTVACS
jgi:type IV fimbrial biogenesis protein FimT